MNLGASLLPFVMKRLIRNDPDRILPQIIYLLALKMVVCNNMSRVWTPTSWCSWNYSPGGRSSSKQHHARWPPVIISLSVWTPPVEQVIQAFFQNINKGSISEGLICAGVVWYNRAGAVVCVWGPRDEQTLTRHSALWFSGAKGRGWVSVSRSYTICSSMQDKVVNNSSCMEDVYITYDSKVLQFQSSKHCWLYL